MDILVTGSSGFVGSAIVPALIQKGYRVGRLVRRAADRSAGEIAWNPEQGLLEKESLPPLKAVIHLAGENIAAGRWSKERKQAIMDSRVRSTTLLARTLASMARPPEAFISASAIGYYGNRGRELVTEDSSPGTGFLARVCQEWEKAAAAADSATRLVNLRIGMILAPKGGALARMLPPFRTGIGGPIGSGEQFISWIAIGDLIEAILFLLANPGVSGPVNAVSPGPVTNREFSRTLGRVLRRPAFFRVPAFIIRMAFGQMGEEVLLSGARVQPARLLAAGYRFRHPELEPTLRGMMRGFEN